MDENKDVLSPENEVENTASDADTAENTESIDNTENIENTEEAQSADSEALFGVFGDELAETQELEISEAVEAQSVASSTDKKNRTIQLPILISLGCVVVVLLAFFIFKGFFNTSIVGTWAIQDSETSTADEASQSTEDEAEIGKYLIFDKDGTASFALGTIEQVGSYTVSEGEDGAKNLTVDISNVLTGTLEYEVTGNIFTGRTLVLTNTYYNSELVMKSASRKIPKLEPADDFKPDEKITGKWDDISDYGISYEFREDGTASMTNSGILYLDGVYTYDDTYITVTYYAGKKIDMPLEYSFDDDVMVINGLGCRRDNGSKK